MLANITPERRLSSMYSPRIEPLLIPIIYQKAKEAHIPMTKFVNQILKEHLTEKVEDKPATTESTTTEIKLLAS